ncbi:MAG: hypothetical protein US76_03370 [Parcubacteria group bacterium GW2011_GWA2_38_13b]|nr:MAG: hypothetical protein US76_03370 [Parcubacteria group bacterium GW2011_GWA2_38_13b]
MVYKITGFDGTAGKSGISIKIKLRGISDMVSFKTKNFERHLLSAPDLYYVVILFLVYNVFLLFLTEIFSIQYCFGLFSFMISMIKNGFVPLSLLFNRDFREWHGAEHKLIDLLMNCGKMDISDFKNSSRISACCGSRSIVWGETLFIYCAMIIWLDKILQYFIGDAYGWIIFVVLFFVFFNQYKKLCDNWFWRPAQKYLLTAEPCEEKTKETLELGLRIKRFTEGGGEDFEE